MDELKILQQRLTSLRKNKSELMRLINNNTKDIEETLKQIEDLDKEAVAKREQHRARQRVQNLSSKQNSIVMCLRNIGEPSTATKICTELGRLGIKKLHNSFFAATYLEAIEADNRIIVTKINATKNKYSLREWTNKPK